MPYLICIIFLIHILCIIQILRLIHTVPHPHFLLNLHTLPYTHALPYTHTVPYPKKSKEPFLHLRHIGHKGTTNNIFINNQHLVGNAVNKKKLLNLTVV